MIRRNLSACYLEEQLKAREVNLKDLEDKIDAKDWIIEQFALEKTENLTSSSSSFADELNNVGLQQNQKLEKDED